jgi:hypothetical protein
MPIMQALRKEERLLIVAVLRAPEQQRRQRRPVAQEQHRRILLRRIELAVAGEVHHVGAADDCEIVLELRVEHSFSDCSDAASGTALNVVTSACASFSASGRERSPDSAR